MKRKKRDAAQLAYMAGLVDGEGSIGIAENKYGHRSTFVRVVVTGTNEDLATWLLANFSGNIYWKRRRPLAWKPEFIWRVSHKTAVILIRELIPFLIVKREQAFLAIRHEIAKRHGTRVSCGYKRGWTYTDATKERLLFIRTQMKLANKRGVSDGEEETQCSQPQDKHITA